MSSSSLSHSTVSITLNRTLSEKRSDGHGFRLQITATGGVGVPNEIFLYQLVPATIVPAAPATGAPVGVTRAYGLADYPVGLPAVGPFPNFYRLDTYDVVVASVLDAEAIWEELLKAVQELISTVRTLDTLGQPLTVTVTSE